MVLGASHAAARTQNSHSVQSMSAGIDPAQLQSAAWAWLVNTATSTEFLVGIAVGLFFAEAFRFTWRAVFKLIGGVAQAANFVVQHRLTVVLTAGVASYAVFRFVL